MPHVVATTEIAPGRFVATPSGELDAFVAPALRETFHGLIDGGASLLVVDLAEIPFIDSSALGALVGSLRRMRERGGELRLVLPRTTARRIFEITGLDEVFAHFASVEQALSDG